VLLRENQSLKPIIQERDELLIARATTQDQLAELEQLKAMKDTFAHQLEATKSELAHAGQLRSELKANHEKLKLIESENAMLKREIESARATADQYRQLHEELSVKVASGSASNEEYTILEKQHRQLTHKVSKFEEDISKKTGEISVLLEKSVRLETELKHVQEQLGLREKEVARQDGLLKLRDKRLRELEQQGGGSSSESLAHVKELMELVNEYQTALAEATVGGGVKKTTFNSAPISPTSMKRRSAFNDHLEPAHGDEPEAPDSADPGPAKKARQSVYHDVQEGEDSQQ
jgi:peptidoglycan hydrolase CwlO-like protein